MTQQQAPPDLAGDVDWFTRRPWRRYRARQALPGELDGVTTLPPLPAGHVWHVIMIRTDDSRGFVQIALSAPPDGLPDDEWILGCAVIEAFRVARSGGADLDPARVRQLATLAAGEAAGRA